MKWVRIIAIFFVVAFVLFFIFNQPENAGSFVHDLIAVIVKIFRSIIIFFQTLTS